MTQGIFSRFLLSAAIIAAPHATATQAADIYVGSGCKAGEMTDRSALVVVRLTSTPGQDARGNIPGREGEARLEYAKTEALQESTTTEWTAANPSTDWSIHFQLRNLTPATRYYYRVEFRTSTAAKA